MIGWKYKQLIAHYKQKVCQWILCLRTPGAGFLNLKWPFGTITQKKEKEKKYDF